MRLFVQIALVAIGSACGGLARWGISVGAGRWLGVGFPYGTLFINLSGCLLLGWFSTVLDQRFVSLEHPWLRRDDLRLLLAVGFTGAFTTFSTFEWETSRMFRDGQSLAGTLYLVGSVALGLLAIHLGAYLARAG